MQYNERYGAIVVGVGAMGAAALYHLARRGVRVLGLEQFEIAHDRGSSHGESRILRFAYFEDPAYVPLSRHALDLWQALERESGERLFRRTGSLDGGTEHSRIFKGSLESCRRHGLDHEVLDAATMRQRFPGFRFPDTHRFVFQPDGGTLHPERCIEAHARMAEALGADLRTGVRVREWELADGGVRVGLDDGSSVSADTLVLTAGGWSSRLLPDDGPRLRVERQVVAWTRPDHPAAFQPELFPVFNVEIAGGHHYGFPALDGRGPKVGRFGHLQEISTADTVRREVTAADRELLQGFADLHLRAAGPIVDTTVCMFTHSVDTHFIVDRVPGMPVVVGCGFSGHGFKFASALGEGLAGLALKSARDPALAPFSWGRRALDPRAKPLDPTRPDD